MSRPSGQVGHRVSRWRMGNETAAGVGTAAPGWLWGLEEDRQTEKKLVINLLLTVWCNFPFSVLKLTAGGYNLEN